MKKKNIAIIGLGGVGGYFGFKINQTNESDKQNFISFIARNETYKVVKEKGLTLLSPEHQNSVTIPDRIYQNISEIEDPDLIFICVKEYDLEIICNQLQNVITKKTILFPMMNGADIYDRIRAIIPNNIILPSCIYVASHIKEKGVVEHKGIAGKLIFGKDPEHFSEDIIWVVNLIRESEINFEFRDNSFSDIWTKFFFIASFGLVTAKHDSSIGEVCDDKTQREEAMGIMEEIKLITDKKGIVLQENIIEETFKKASTFPPETPTSLQLDVNSGKENSELELFAGAIIKYGTVLNIKHPCTQKIYEEIKAVLKNK
jgi:2-dehydropantoate 2-reductase